MNGAPERKAGPGIIIGERDPLDGWVIAPVLMWIGKLTEDSQVTDERDLTWGLAALEPVFMLGTEQGPKGIQIHMQPFCMMPISRMRLPEHQPLIDLTQLPAFLKGILLKRIGEAEKVLQVARITAAGLAPPSAAPTQ